MRIFVFGSNLAGRHGAGAAAAAHKEHGAQYGVGRGRTGFAYAIPTKDERLRTLSLDYIKLEVEEFLRHARANPHDEFFVTRIGCGLAGYTSEQIAPMFKDAPTNCILDDEWIEILESPCGGAE